MRSFTVTGVHQDGGAFVPQLVVSKDVSQNVNLLNVSFETNPLGTVHSILAGVFPLERKR